MEKSIPLEQMDDRNLLRSAPVEMTEGVNPAKDLSWGKFKIMVK